MPTISWSRSGRTLSASEDHGGKYSWSPGNHTLHISRLTFSDAGQYRCNATNDVGSRVFTIDLRVYSERCLLKLGFHDADTDADILADFLARILARKSLVADHSDVRMYRRVGRVGVGVRVRVHVGDSASWNASLTRLLFTFDYQRALMQATSMTSVRLFVRNVGGL